jgi:hypothetical protein
MFAFEKEPVSIDERDQGEWHLEDARQFGSDAVEDRLSVGVEELQLPQGGQAIGVIAGNRRGAHRLEGYGCKFGDSHHGVGE